MLTDPPLEKLLEKAENRYTLSISVAKRARQIQDGALPLIGKSKDLSTLTLASEEFASDKYVALPGKLEPVVPLRPEVEEALLMARDNSDEEDDLLPSFTPQERTEIEQEPVSKIRFMKPDEMFYMPYEVEEQDEEDEGLDEDLDELSDDEGDEVVEKVKEVPLTDDDEEIVSDEELDSIDGSIDYYKDEEEEDYE